jgi:hypothetical protein
MDRPSAIPEHLVDLAAEMFGDRNPRTGRRWTYRDLAAWLHAEHGLDVSRECVRRAVKPVRAERAELRREILRDRIGATLSDQLDTLDALLVKLAKDAQKAKPMQRVDLVDVYRKALETKLRFSGVGERVEAEAEVHVDAAVSVTDARDELAESLAREAAGAARSRAARPAGDPPT